MHELIQLSKESIKCYLLRKKLEVPEKIIRKYCEKKACFVTLTINGELRGCIGNIIPCQELYKDVIDNSIHAAFDDPRFMPLEESEFEKLKIEISILNVPEKLEYKNENDLLKKLNHDMGIILKKGHKQATFLPQVWKELPKKIEFLEQLSKKAGLFSDDWKTAEYWYYKVKKI